MIRLSSATLALLLFSVLFVSGEAFETLEYGENLTSGMIFSWNQTTSEKTLDTGTIEGVSLIIEIELKTDLSGIDFLNSFMYADYFILRINKIPLETYSFYLSTTVRYGLIFPVVVNGTDNYFELAVNDGTDIFPKIGSSISNGIFTYDLEIAAGDASVTHVVKYDVNSGILQSHNSVDKNAEREITLDISLFEPTENSSGQSTNLGALYINFTIWSSLSVIFLLLGFRYRKKK